MSDKAISVENLGPIAHFEFSGSKPGVTVFSGPNGVGKSIFQKAIQSAARGKGKVPLRDKTRHGRVDAFGATITIGQNCRHTGSFEVLSLDGRFNLADLVDPRIDNPGRADNARIKALVSLTGVEASVDLFRTHKAFADTFGDVVKTSSIETDDLVQMASKIKDDYDTAARAQEAVAERQLGQATALISPSDLDLDAESDQTALQEAYNEARDEMTRLAEQARNAENTRKQVEDAKKLLEQLGDDELRKERETLSTRIESANSALVLKSELGRKLHEQIAILNLEIKEVQSELVNSSARIASIDRELTLVDGAKKVLADSALVEAPEEEDIAYAKEEVANAAVAIETGVKIRTAKENETKMRQHREAAKKAKETAARYREAGKATDEVLSTCIKCAHLRVESDGKDARLVTETVRGDSTLYHELSDGQKWKIAIDIGADAVGEDGLLTVDQIGWEGIDADNRIVLDEHGKERGVHIWVLEASRVAGAPREIVARPFDGTEFNPAPKPPAVTPDPPTPAAVEPPKPKAKPKAKPKPAPEPMDDEDDLPFF